VWRRCGAGCQLILFCGKIFKRIEKEKKRERKRKKDEKQRYILN
jgi:hypothetical protein